MNSPIPAIRNMAELDSNVDTAQASITLIYVVSVIQLVCQAILNAC